MRTADHELVNPLTTIENARALLERAEGSHSCCNVEILGTIMTRDVFRAIYNESDK